MKFINALSSLHQLVTSHLEALAERIPAAEVQKFRDALQESSQVLLSPDLGTEQADAPYVPTLPPFVQELLDKAHAEFDRRAQSDADHAAIAHRSAVALEAIASKLDALLVAAAAAQASSAGA